MKGSVSSIAEREISRGNTYFSYSRPVRAGADLRASSPASSSKATAAGCFVFCSTQTVDGSVDPSRRPSLAAASSGRFRVFQEYDDFKIMFAFCVSLPVFPRTSDRSSGARNFKDGDGV
ncbi:unnamed protein product [Victoria cruziana]